MRHAEKKKEKDKIAIALMLCFCVIALTSIFIIRSNISKISSNSNVPVSDRVPTQSAAESDKASKKASESPDSKDSSVPGSVSVPTVDSLDGKQKEDTPAPVPPESQAGAALFRHPVHAADAYVTNKFSMDSLIYSVTLDQYMTHCGVDIEAPADTQVQAMADGTVTAVYVDDRYGNSVEIRHNGQFTAIYSNLSDAHMVEIGDTVTAGQIIGGVGMTGLFESLEPAHLHLELLKDGVYVDPMEYIG